MAKQLNKSIQGNKINFQVNLNVNKTGLNDLQKSLSGISSLTQSDLMDINKGMNLEEADAKLKQIRQTVTTVKQSLSNAFNKDLGTVNVTKFNNELGKAGMNVKQLYQTFAMAGIQGKAAFRSLTAEVLSTEVQLKKTHNILNDMANTMANTIKWGVASSVMNGFSGSVQKAYGYVKELDKSLNDIRIVTGKSAEDMDRFAKEANKAAQSLGAQTTTYTDAALIYYQQGLQEEDVKARAEATVKTANVTGMSGSETSEALTAVWNGYKVKAEETELYVDKLAKVAAGTAADLEELSTGMSKVASAANTAGVDIDQLNAILGTVVSVTREAPETIGSGFKTIFARMGDLALDGQDEFGVKLGNVSGKLHSLGIELLDEQGNMRDMGTVIEEVAAKWDGWTRAQKQAAAVAMAGKMQYSRLMALFENWDMYNEALDMSKNSVGELQNQQDIYMESTQAHLDKMQASFQGLYSALLDPDSINGTTDAISGIVQQLTNVVEGFNGGAGALQFLGSTALRVFSQQIGGGIATTIMNIKNMNDNIQQAATEMQMIELFKGAGITDTATQDIIDMKEELLSLNGVLSEEQQNQALLFIKTREEIEKEADAIKAAEEKAKDFLQTRTDADLSKIKDKNGNTDFSIDNEGSGEISQALEKTNRTIDLSQKKIQSLKNAYSIYNKEVSKAGGDQDKLKESFKKLQKQMDSTRNTMGKLSDFKIMDEKATDKLNEAIVEYDRVMADSDENAKAAEEAGEKLLSVFQEVTTELENNVQNVENVVNDASNNVLGEIEKKGASVKNQFHGFMEEFQLKDKIAEISNLVGSVGQLAMVLQSIRGLGEIWSDKDASTGEKLLKTFETLAMVVPMVIAGYSGMVKAAGKLTTVTVGEMLAKKASTKATAEDAIASGADATAKTGEAAATEGATLAQWALNAAMEANPIVLIITALALLVAGIAAFITIAGNAAKKQRENRDASIEEANALQEEIDAVNEIYDAYLKTEDAYKKGTASKDEMREATKSLTGYINEEDIAVANLTGDYDKLTESVLKAQKAKAKEGMKSAKDELTNTGDNLIETARDGQGYKSGDNYKLDLKMGFTYGDEEEYYKLANKMGVISDKELDNGLQGINPTITTGLNEKDIVELYEKLQKLQTKAKETVKDYQDSEAYNGVRDWLNKMKDDVEAYKKAQQDLDKYASQYAETTARLNSEMKVSDVKTYEDFKKYRDEYVDQLKKVFKEEGIKKSDKEIGEMADNYLKQLGDLETFVDQYNVGEKLKKQFKDSDKDVKEFINSLTGEDYKILASIDIDENATIDEVKKALAAGKAAAQSDMAETQMATIKEVMAEIQENNSLEKLDEETKALWEDLLKTLNITEEWNDVSKLGATNMLDYLSDIQTQLGYANQNSVGMKMQQLQATEELREAELKRLEDTYGKQAELTEKINSYEKGDKSVFGSEEDYNKAKKHLQEIIDKSVELAGIRDELGSRDWSFDITLEGLDDILTAGDSIVSESQKIKESAELIGEGFKVAKEDARKLLEIYPELYENSEVLKDGTIQLSQETVKELLGDQAEIVNGDTEAQIAKLENQKKLLQGILDSAQADLDIMNEKTDAEIDADAELKKSLIDNENELGKKMNEAYAAQVKNDTAASNAKIKNADDVGDEHAKAADNSQTNWINSLVAAGEVANSFGGNVGTVLGGVMTSIGKVANAIKDMFSGKNSTSNVGSASGKTKGSTKPIKYMKKGSASGTYTAISSDISAANLRSEIQSRVSKLSSSIAKIDVQISELRSGQYNANKAIGGASSGAGGSQKSGGSSSSKKADKMENESGNLDIYHDVNIQLELIQKNLDKIQSQQSKFFGQKLIDNLNQQLALLNKQLDKTKEKLGIATSEALTYKNQLGSFGATFNSDGSIANYEQLYTQELNRLNNTINAYNAMSATQQESYKATVEAAKDRFNNVTGLISSYDTLLTNTIPTLEKEIQSIIDKQIEIQIKEFDMEIEISLNLKEAEKEWLDFKKKVIDKIKDDNILGTAQYELQEFFSYYKENGTGIIQEDVKYLQNLMKEIDQYNATGNSSVYGNNQTAMQSDLEKYSKQLMSDLGSAQDLIDSIKDAVNKTFNDIADRMAEQKGYYEDISEILEHDMKLVQLTYGDEAFDKLNVYYEQQAESHKNQLEFQKAQEDFWEEQMNAAEANSEAWKTAKNNWIEAIKATREELETYLDTLLNKYINAIKTVFQELNTQITGGKGLDLISTEWELIKKRASEYLDTINTTYGIQKLQNKYLQSIKDTDNLAAQRELNKLMEEQIGDLKERDRLTEYDLQRAELRYQIALKQIALQEAQQNKSTMRLKRDSQGNYSYQYVSDNDEVAKAQEELSDLYNQLYNLDTERYSGNLDQVYELWTEYQEKMAEAAAINDPEARLQKEQLLTQQYGDLINGIVDQNEQIKRNLYESTFFELEDLYGKQAEIVQDFLDNQDEAMSLLVSGWASGLQEMADQIYADGGFVSVYEQALADIGDATQRYEQELDTLKSQYGDVFDGLGNSADASAEKINGLIGTTSTLITTYNDEVDAIKNLVGQAEALAKFYDEQVKGADIARQAQEKLIKSYQDAQKAAAANSSNSGGGNSSSGGSSPAPASSGGGGGAGNANRMPSVGQWVTYNGGYYYADSYGNGGRGSRGPGKRVKVTIVKNDGRPYPIHVESSDSAYGWLRKDQLSGYDTGGYTGSWGSTEGRVALLHEKELVLNKEDTKNLLDTVEVMRNLTNSLGSSILKQMASMSRIGINGMVGGEVVEQDVHIDAQFPNVRDSREIENALNNLVNAAAQRANKR